jgi:hypothetical protein
MSKPKVEILKDAFPKLLWGLSCLVILGAIAGGMSLTGGPQKQRFIKLDAQRERDLFRIERNIISYYNDHEALPLNLTTLERLPKQYEDSDQDPQTNQYYDYQKLGAEQFQLCAVFSEPTQESGNAAIHGFYSTGYAFHPKGKACFIRERNHRNDYDEKHVSFHGVKQ